MNVYAATIAELAPGYNPRHIEAYMRDANGNLAALSARKFAQEVIAAIHCVNFHGVEFSDKMADCMGL
jgi:hypothetical protein